MRPLWAKYGLDTPLSLILFQPPSARDLAEDYLQQVSGFISILRLESPALSAVPAERRTLSIPAHPLLSSSFLPLGWATWWREMIPLPLREQIVRTVKSGHDPSGWRDELCAVLAGSHAVTLRTIERRLAREMPGMWEHRLASSQRPRRRVGRVRGRP